MPNAPLRIALAQLSPKPGDVAANVRTAAATITDAAARGAGLVAFPELFLSSYDLPLLEATPAAWITPGDARLDPVRDACARTGATAILSAALRGPEGERFISAPVIGPRGDVGISNKEHVHASEAHLFRPGTALAPFDVHGWRVAVAVCFDGAHPRHAERAARAGADLYVSTALYAVGEERRCDLHFGARAMDNRIYAALANYAATTGGCASCGLSGVWGPSGKIVAREETAAEKVLVVELQAAELARYRK